MLAAMATGVGRKRSEEARRAILDAAVELLRERGYGSVTVDEIAARAGVGKQTIYRWWKSKPDVVLEALTEHASKTIPVPDTGALEGDLAEFLAATFRALEGTRSLAAVMRGLMAHAQLDEAFAERFRAYIEGRRATLRDLLARGRARGELPDDLDADLVIDMLFGAMWYRLLLGHAPLGRRAATALAAIVGRLGRGALPARKPRAKSPRAG
jgi:AcrR family transcriptional regulator